MSSLSHFVDNLLEEKQTQIGSTALLDALISKAPPITRTRKFINKWKRIGYQAKMAYLVLIGRASISEYY